MENPNVFKVDHYQVTIYDSGADHCPIVYTNTINGEDYVLWITCQQMHLPPFVMVAVTDLNWSTDMAPWYCPPCGPGDTPCYPGADQYLQTLTEQIVPQAEQHLGRVWSRRILAGYSLAGLFASYALYHTDLFDETVIGSGSFWYSDYIRYVKEHEMLVRPEKMYFSLGRLESHTQFPIFNTVQTRTEELVAWYQNKGIDVKFVMEPGDHYTDPSGRMARGIAWILAEDHAKDGKTL